MGEGSGMEKGIESLTGTAMIEEETEEGTAIKLIEYTQMKAPGKSFKERISSELFFRKYSLCLLRQTHSK